MTKPSLMPKPVPAKIQRAFVSFFKTRPGFADRTSMSDESGFSACLKFMKFFHLPAHLAHRRPTISIYPVIFRLESAGFFFFPEVNQFATDPPNQSRLSGAFILLIIFLYYTSATSLQQMPLAWEDLDL
jgi:hypothetical protein